MRGDRTWEYLASQPLAVTREALEAAIAIVNRPAAVETRRGEPHPEAEGEMAVRDGVAVIQLVGPITRYASYFTYLCGGATVEQIALDLRTALEDDGVKAILLYVDSPGGEANGIAELAATIRAAAAAKPVVAYAAGQMCSAAYWLGSAAGEVVCDATAWLGSIGTVMGYPLPRKDGRYVEFVSSQSPNKRPDVTSDAGRAEVQRIVDDLTAVFLADVARYRGTTPERVASGFGAGGVKVGMHAVKAGMADRLGSFEGVLSDLAAGRARRPRPLAAAAAGSIDPMRIFGLTLKPKSDGTLEITPAADNAAESEPAGGQSKPSEASGAQPTQPASSAAANDLQAQLDAERKRRVDAERRAVTTAAAASYNRLFLDNRILPAEQQALLDAYAQAAVDDLEHPLEGGKARTAMVEGLFANRPRHALTNEQLDANGKPEGGSDQPGGESKGEVDPKRLENLIAMLGDAGYGTGR